MRHITMTCPECGTPDKAVGDPHELDGGKTGKWYCFHCRSRGEYGIEFDVDEPEVVGD